jgi:hypothetical protein
MMKVSAGLIALAALGLSACATSAPKASQSSSSAETAAPVDPAAVELLTQYVRVQEGLAADSVAQALPAAKDLAATAGKLAASQPDNPAYAKIRVEALKLSKVKGLKNARGAFKKLSEPVVELQRRSGSKDFEIAYCSMADAKWVQKPGKIRNPYYGSEMLECGEKSS